MGCLVTLLGMVGDDQKISSVQNFRPLGAVKAYNSCNNVDREGGTFCVLSRDALQIRIGPPPPPHLVVVR